MSNTVENPVRITFTVSSEDGMTELYYADEEIEEQDAEFLIRLIERISYVRNEIQEH